MEFFDKLSESLVSAGKDVSQKAKDVSEIAKLKLDIKSKEDYVQKQYEELDALIMRSTRMRKNVKKQSSFS